ncbi:hypothetical protein SK128_002339 [Halocaridina rubra]|uniref:Hyaluronidase n=1 Tax=Halocaridina rubra TaxID=373956 RepID=A0AAN8XIA9_HALRR
MVFVMYSKNKCISLILWAILLYSNVSACDIPYEKPFTVYWNVPSYVCQRHGIYINASQFGIIQNTDDTFHGDKIDINYHPGRFPYLLGNFPVNGGIPQRGCMLDHATIFKNQVESMPKDFSGLAVLDFEYYLPSFYSAPRAYKKASREWITFLHPNWTTEDIEAEVVETFNNSTKKLMEVVLHLANKLRPNAKWGYYHYPYCKNREGKFNCTDNMLALNDEMVTWLYNESKALYPSIYVQKGKGFDDLGRRNMAMGRINEALRIRHQLQKNIPIYTYFRGLYKDTDEYLETLDILNTMGVSRLAGIDGTIIWGRSDDVSSPEKCAALKQNLETSLGPLVQDIITRNMSHLRRLFRTYKIQKKLEENNLPKTEKWISF